MMRFLFRKLAKIEDDREELEKVITQTQKEVDSTVEVLKRLNEKLNNGVSLRIYQTIRGLP